eukprot:3505435-Pyramimonas_sp.AAC.1
MATDWLWPEHVITFLFRPLLGHMKGALLLLFRGILRHLVSVHCYCCFGALLLLFRGIVIVVSRGSVAMPLLCRGILKASSSLRGWIRLALLPERALRVACLPPCRAPPRARRRATSRRRGG